MKKRSDGAALLLESIVKGIYEKNGQDVVKIDLRNLETRITDYFIICHASSVTQVDAICYSVEEMVQKGAREKPAHVEGLDNCYWVLLDYGNVVVHIFLEEYRHVYNLESLWADAKIEVMQDLIQ